jgi:TolA-binding protein
MRKNIFFIYIICFLYAISSCTPPSRLTSNEKASKNTTGKKTAKAEEVKKNDRIDLITSKTRTRKKKSQPFEERKKLLKDVTSDKDRFIDTTYYFLFMEDGETKIGLADNATPDANIKQYRENLIVAFNKSIEDLENKNFSNCNTFKYFINKFDFNDSLRQEATFYLAECNIMNNQIDEDLSNLESISNAKLNRAVAPKILVRIGQIYCLLGDNSQAEQYFKRLKKSYPNSIYNKLADCSRL